VTIDDRKVEPTHCSLDADGVNVHAFLMPRARFRAAVESSLRNSFLHSLFAKGRLLYTHDESLAGLFDELRDVGERDTQVQLLEAGTEVLPAMYKARKWLLTRGDLEYSALWILYTARALARLEVISRRMIADREVIPQALKLHPSLFRTIYTDLLNREKTRADVEAALITVEAYMAQRAPTLFTLVIEYLRDAGEARSATEIETYFQRNLDVGGVITACEYLADLGLIGRAATPVRLTKRSTVALQELAFFAL
jgi:hypothetical protein